MTKKETVPKYDFRKSYFYFCPICKVSENYQMPELMAQEALSKREIVKISLKETIPERNVCMVYDYQHPLNSAAKELKKMIMEE